MRQFITLLVVSFLLSGCTLINEYEDSYKFKYMHSTSTTDFSNLTEDLLDPICPKIKNIRNSIYVTDFVNVKELENHSELGFMLSEELKTHVTQLCDTSVHAIEYSKYLKLGANGTKLLSRDLKDIKNTQIAKNGYALVGTYALTQRQLILYLKLIDLNTGVIIKSSTEPTTLTDEIIHLEEKARRNTPQYIQAPMVL